MSESFLKTRYLTGLRAYAALGVFLIHAGGGGLVTFSSFTREVVHFGKYGVMVFFVLSAVTVCMSVDCSAERYSYGRYLLKRAFRIVPLYYIMLLFGFWLGGCKVHLDLFGIQNDLKNLILHLSFLNYFDVRYKNSIIGIEWTIPLEFIYYMVIPSLFFWVRRFNKQKIVYFLLVAFVISRLSREIFGFMYNPEFKNLTEHWSVEKYLFTYACGIVCYVNLKKNILIRNSSLVLACVFLLLFLYIYSPIHQPSPIFVISVFAWVVILVSSQGGWLSVFLFENPIVMFLGKISYSIYLTHKFILSGLPSILPGLMFGSDYGLFVVMLIATVLVSTITYYLIERPFINFGKRFTT